MRLQPVITRNCNVNRINKNQTQFEKNSGVMVHRGQHQYTGNWSADLAYASLVDANIANDLRAMNLIV